MVWRVEIAKSAVAELDKLDPQVARRILLFLHQRIVNLDNPRANRRVRLRTIINWCASAPYFRNAINHEYQEDTKVLSVLVAEMLNLVEPLMAIHRRAEQYCRAKLGVR